MKLIYFFCLTLLFSALIYSCDSPKISSANENQVTITGEITNPNGDSVWVKLYTALGTVQTKYGAALDSIGKFELKFDIDLPQAIRFSDRNESTQMFVNPGDILHLILNTKEFDETIKYSGIGSEKNNYLAEKYLEFDDKGLLSIYNMRDSLSVDGGIVYLDSIKGLRLQLLNKYINNNSLSTEFLNWEKTNIEFEYPNILFEFTYNRPIDSTLKKIYQVLGSYLKVKPLDSMAIQYAHYLYIYNFYLYDENRELLKNNDTRDSVMLSLIISNTDGYAKNKMIAEMFMDNILDYNPGFFDEHSDVFNDHITNDAFKEIILSNYDSMVKLLDNKIPSGAKLINLENEKYKNLTYQDIIDKYKGKVIYLDFWASWCGPCKAEMPFSLAHQEYFKNKDVAFVYFSSDKDSLAWKKLIKVLKITGDHYRLSKTVRKVTNEKFDVKYIPRYVLIDKEGNVVNDQATRPSSPEIIKEIENLL